MKRRLWLGLAAVALGAIGVALWSRSRDDFAFLMRFHPVRSVVASPSGMGSDTYYVFPSGTSEQVRAALEAELPRHGFTHHVLDGLPQFEGADEVALYGSYTELGGDDKPGGTVSIGGPTLVRPGESSVVVVHRPGWFNRLMKSIKDRFHPTKSRL